LLFSSVPTAAAAREREKKLFVIMILIVTFPSFLFLSLDAAAPLYIAILCERHQRGETWNGGSRKNIKFSLLERT
jgi:hypothetical protein